MDSISWNDFTKIDIRVGTVIDVIAFPEARIPAWKLTLDFGEQLGILRSSAQITNLYEGPDLMGKQLLAVVNFPKKQIGHFMSECLVLGLESNEFGVVLVEPDRNVRNGLRLS